MGTLSESFEMNVLRVRIAKMGLLQKPGGSEIKSLTEQRDFFAPNYFRYDIFFRLERRH